MNKFIFKQEHASITLTMGNLLFVHSITYMTFYSESKGEWESQNVSDSLPYQQAGVGGTYATTSKNYILTCISNYMVSSRN